MEQSESLPNLNAEIIVIPKTLKTLGILSLIMGGLMIVMGLWNIKTTYAPSESDTEKTQIMLEQVEKNSPEKYEDAVKLLDNAGPQAVAGVLTQIISVIGVILMLKLKKNGFYIYLFGELLPYIITIALLGLNGFVGAAAFFGETAALVGWIVFGLMIVLDIVFIVLYSKQVKYMS